MENDLAIIGASYLQLPLIEKAKGMGYTTHVFAWAADDAGEKAADHFYPISIVEKDAILAKCREIGIIGICSIASDLAMLTVNYVADAMGLTGNSPEATLCSTNKHLMRLAFQRHGDPSPLFSLADTAEEAENVSIPYPLIVKPLDRSGSRGITKLLSPEGMPEAVERAKTQGFEKHVLVEEYVTGREYSVECISWQGKHSFLAVTKKFTTGSPHFIETGHLEPSLLPDEKIKEIRDLTFHALDSLGIRNGASHTELKISDDGRIRLIEIGGRMGGDCIGSDLVYLSTGVDFVRAVVDIAVGREPDLRSKKEKTAAGIRFVFSEDDLNALKLLKREHPEYLIREDIQPVTSQTVSDSAARFGYYLFAAPDAKLLLPYLPTEKE